MISFFSIYLVAKIAFLALRISKICLRRRFLCGDRGYCTLGRGKITDVGTFSFR